MNISKYKLAILAFIVANTIWGGGAPIFKWSLQGISPLMLAFYRFSIPVVVLFFFYKKMQRPRIRDAFYFMLLGIFDCTFNIGLYFLGLLYAPSINAPVIGSSGPIIVILFSAMFLRDRPSRRLLFGNLVGLTGVLFIVLEPLLHAHETYSLYGNLLFILATISGSLGTIVSKKLANRYNATTLTFWTFFVALLTLLPVPVDEFFHHTLFVMPSLPAAIGIVFGGIFSSLLAYMLFYMGLRYIKASETTIFSYIDPVVALVIAAPLLHEYPSPIFIFGSILVFFGIYVAEGRIHWHPVTRLFDTRS